MMSIRSIPSRSWIASSIGIQIPFSTSSGVAFGYGTMIAIASIAVSGKISFFREPHVTIPPTSTAIIAKFAATWLRQNHKIIPCIASP